MNQNVYCYLKLFKLVRTQLLSITQVVIDLVSGYLFIHIVGHFKNVWELIQHSNIDMIETRKTRYYFSFVCTNICKTKTPNTK